MALGRLGGLALAAFVALWTLPGAATAAPRDLDQVRADAEWILSAQEPDGSIRTHPDSSVIWPYLANSAALGLVRAATLTGDPRYSAAAWHWLQWYQAHQNAFGFVTDYEVSPSGVPTSTGTMDSTDAYAGTFLLAADEAWRHSGDAVRLATLERGIRGAVRAIEATRDADGLTWAKPGWPVKYLMDQAETYAGLRAAEHLALALGDAALAEHAGAMARRMRRGVGRMWDRRRGAFHWARHSDGEMDRTNWKVLYPDALQQVWAVAFGLVEGRRAERMMERFAARQPRWDRPAARGRYRPGMRPVGYWVPAAWAFELTGDRRRAGRGAARIRRAAVAADRSWPFTVADAGHLLAGASGPLRRRR